MQIAFYRGRTRLFNRLVAWWLRGPYSHCELLTQALGDGRYLCASASFMDGGVRLKAMDLHPDRWDIVSVNADASQAREWFYRHQGEGYDVPGLLGFVWRRAENDQKRWFCSEAVAAALGYADAWRFDPCALYAALTHDASRPAR